MFDALAQGTDPDRMKGALYVLWSKGTGTLLYQPFASIV
jgi:membrane-bound inhibitor of C-type lysozyme